MRDEPPGTIPAAAFDMDRVTHWDRVYTDKRDMELSWFQTQSALSLEVIDRLALPKDAAIIDVGGGGPSALAGELLDRGFTDISVLDVSAVGLHRCRERLGDRADVVHWLERDVTRFDPPAPVLFLARPGGLPFPD